MASIGRTLPARAPIATVISIMAFIIGLPASAFAESAPEILDVPLVDIALPQLPEDDRSGGLIAHDLDGDGVMDFLVTHPGIIVAIKSDGRILWQRDTDIQVTHRSERNGLPGHHAPGIQAADVTGNGDVEVLYLTRSGELHIVDGATGEDIRRITLAAPADAERWEHLVVGNFRGLGDRDLLLQTTNTEGYRFGRFLTAYAIDDLLQQDTPTPLWTRDDFIAAAHNGARIADLNGDGRDEIIGGSIISPDGEKLYDAPLRYASPERGHIDAVQIANVRPDLPGLEVIALEERGSVRLLPFSNRFANWVNWNFHKFWGAGNRIFLMNTEGLIWASHHKQIEPQNTAAGTFQRGSDQVQIWLRSRFNIDPTPFLFDARGNLVASYPIMATAPEGWPREGVEVINPIHWTGTGQQYLAVKARHVSGDVAIIDALTGEFLVRIPENTDRLYVVDVLGDWREEIVIVSANQLRIYGNAAENPNPGYPSLWSQQHYQRSKQTWNYYSP